MSKESCENFREEIIVDRIESHKNGLERPVSILEKRPVVKEIINREPIPVDQKTQDEVIESKI